MNKHYLVKIGIFAIIVCTVILIVVFYNDLAIYFAKDNYKGEFFKVILTSLGGLGVLYGLYLNSKRIKQGNEQLLQQEKNNTNTRFKDAIALLGNDNPAIVLGGIHSLNQMAIDNPNYSVVIAKTLCSYVRILSNKLEGKYNYNNYVSVVQLIVDCVFSNTYYDVELDFSDAYFESIKFKNQILPNIIIDGCRFDNCQFQKLDLCENIYQNIFFNNCTLNYVCLFQTRMSNVFFANCAFQKKFIALSPFFTKVSFKGCKFKNLDISCGHFFELIMTKSVFDGGKIVNNIFDYGCTIEDNNFIKVTFDNPEIRTNYANNKYKDCNDQIDN